MTAAGVPSPVSPLPLPLPLLSMEGITRRFGPTLALDNASLVVRPGTVHAVLGENGAGKTTLLRLAFGMLQPDAGMLRWRGEPTTVASPSDALRRGIGMVHQHFTLVPAMTVAENVALGERGMYDPARAAARVRDVARRAGLAVDPEARVSALAVGAQQRCEIVKALARDVELLILDEPTAVLAPQEAAELLAWTRAYADAGHAVVLITHKLRDALGVADDVTVLRRGRTVLTTAARAVTEADLADAMIGGEAEKAEKAEPEERAIVEAEMASGVAHRSSAPGPVVLSARGVRARDGRGVERLRGVTLEVRAGEIVGIAAVEGAGQQELLRVLARRLAPDSGVVASPDTIGFIPEDRHHDALVLDAPLYENVALRDVAARRGRMTWAAFRGETRRIIAAYDVRTPGESISARSLSGGNQQKLVLGRELAGAPAAIVAENPSRGLDFRATAAVHASLRAARDGGAAVVVYSSDLDELLLLADRIFAMHDGTLAETARDRETVGRAMLGGAA
ncbi:MAG: ATP-binding cassette domain-containing protein [Gemmatimonadota bacterium]